MINRYLSYYQIIGIIISMTLISIWAFKEGGIMPFSILFTGVLFLPFAIVSIFSLLDIDKYEKAIQVSIWSGTILLLAPSYSLPFFFEWGGLLIALICTLIGISLWKKRKEIKWQVSIFNVIGTVILTFILIILIKEGLA